MLMEGFLKQHRAKLLDRFGQVDLRCTPSYILHVLIAFMHKLTYTFDLSACGRPFLAARNIHITKIQCLVLPFGISIFVSMTSQLQVDDGSWRPAPRSGHTCVAMPRGVAVFGGERANGRCDPHLYVLDLGTSLPHGYASQADDIICSLESDPSHSCVHLVSNLAHVHHTSRYPAYAAKYNPPWEWRQIPTTFNWKVDERELPRYAHASSFYPGYASKNGDMEGSALIVFGGLGQMGMPQRGLFCLNLPHWHRSLHFTQPLV